MTSPVVTACSLAAAPLADDMVMQLPETNTGDPNVLLEFIRWGFDQYPAERYALILWNHGTGWKDDDLYKTIAGKPGSAVIGRDQMRAVSAGRTSRALFSTTIEQMVQIDGERAILLDDTSADFLDNIEMKNVLGSAAQCLGRPIDLLGFDACLMNMVEVAAQVSGSCGVIVGSQEIEPGEGWPYDAILQALKIDPGMDADQLGGMIVEHYVDFYQKNYPNTSVTQSAVRTDRLESLLHELDILAVLLEKGVSKGASTGLVFEALRNAQSFKDRDYLDLGHFCQVLAQSSPKSRIGKAAAVIASRIAGSESPVIARGYSGQEVENATGLSIYLPARSLSPLYASLDFSQKYHWDEFLKAFVN